MPVTGLPQPLIERGSSSSRSWHWVQRTVESLRPSSSCGSDPEYLTAVKSGGGSARCALRKSALHLLFYSRELRMVRAPLEGDRLPTPR